MLHTLRFSLQNAVYFIMLPFLVHILFTFYSRVRKNLNVKLRCQKVKFQVLLMYMVEGPSLHGEVIRSVCAEGVRLWHFNLVTYFEHRFRLKLRTVTRFCGQGILSAAKYRQLGAV